MAKRIPRDMEMTFNKQMFFDFKEELKELITSRFEKMQAQIDGVKADVHGFRAEMHGMKSEISEMRSDIASIKSELAIVKADVHAVRFLSENQKQENLVAMDGARHVMEEIVKIRERMDHLEEKY